MSRTIVLSVSGVNRTLTLDSVSNTGQATFTEKAGPLVGRLRLRTRIKPNAAGSVLRSSLVLSAARVTTGVPATGELPKVVYEQVWSHDVSVVQASSEEDRTSLYDLTAALVANAEIKAMIVNGTDPSI